MVAAARAQTLPVDSRIDRVIIRTAPIFGESARGLRWIANRLHSTTREETIRRELWVAEGDHVNTALAEEVERNLRRTGLFASAKVRLEPGSRQGLVDLVIETRDRLSIQGGGSGSFVGGVGRVGASIGENNLLGLGDRISLSYSENSLGELRGQISYTDRHIGDSFVRGRVSVGRTDDGDFQAAGIERRFQHLRDPFAWSVNVSRVEARRDFFGSGDTVAEVAEDRERLDLGATWRSGPIEHQWRRGALLRHADTAYGPAVGPAAGAIEVPGDTRTTFGGGLVGLEMVEGFRKVRGLDTLDFVQDLALGTRYELVAGVTWRDEDGERERLEPTASVSASQALDLGRDMYATASLRGTGRTYAGDLRGWAAGASLRAFAVGRGPHTLAARLDFEAAFEGDDLPAQLTLGEGSGLRGYPLREFEGDRRLRFNLEDRLDWGLQLGNIDLGLVGFYDAGWIWSRGGEIGDPVQSLGLGLRIGSTRLLGSGVIRVDLAFPLDQPGGEEFDPLVSVSLGQVFGFR